MLKVNLFRENTKKKDNKKTKQLYLPDLENDGEDFEVQLSEEKINELKELAKKMAK